MPYCDQCQVTYEGDAAAPCPLCGRAPGPAPDDEGGRRDACATVAEENVPLLRCRACGVRFMGREGDACPRCGRQVGQAPRGLPWQERRESRRSRFRAVLRMLWRLHTRPRKTFAEFQFQRGLIEPMSFLLWMFYTTLGVWIVLTTARFIRRAPAPVEFFKDAAREMSRSIGRPFGWGQRAYTPVYALLLLLLVICVCALFVIVISALVNLILRLFREKRGGVLDTAAVYFYAFGAAAVWLCIQPQGWYVWVVAGFAMSVAGLAAVHNTTICLVLIAHELLLIPPALLMWIQAACDTR